MISKETKYYAVVIGNEVAVRLVVVSDGSDDLVRMTSALSSDPKIVETTNINPEIDFGWSYDGTEFIPPIS